MSGRGRGRPRKKKTTRASEEIDDIPSPLHRSTSSSSNAPGASLRSARQRRKLTHRDVAAVVIDLTDDPGLSTSPAAVSPSGPPTTEVGTAMAYQRLQQLSQRQNQTVSAGSSTSVAELSTCRPTTTEVGTAEPQAYQRLQRLVHRHNQTCYAGYQDRLNPDALLSIHECICTRPHDGLHQPLVRDRASEQRIRAIITSLYRSYHRMIVDVTCIHLFFVGASLCCIVGWLKSGPHHLSIQICVATSLTHCCAQ